jgi:hypothetical protein
MGSLSALRSFAISVTRDVYRVEDLVQDTVLKAISKEKFDASSNLQAWLFTSATCSSPLIASPSARWRTAMACMPPA